MNLRLLLPAVALSFTLAAHADDTFHRTVTAGSQPDLYVSTGSGNIHIMPGNGDALEITGHVHASWGASGDVRERIERIVSNPPIQQNGNAVHVGETPDRALYNNISIDYEIKAPASVALNLRSGSGDLEVDGLGRFLAASTGSGSIRSHGVHGPATLDSGSGDVELDETGMGDVKARSGSGNIHVHGINGALAARTGSGDIEADGHLHGPSTLSSGSGGVRLLVTPDSRFNLEASTGSGDLRVHLPGFSPAGQDTSRHHITMSINGGGDPLQIRTGSGNIEVSPR